MHTVSSAFFFPERGLPGGERGVAASAFPAGCLPRHMLAAPSAVSTARSRRQRENRKCTPAARNKGGESKFFEKKSLKDHKFRFFF